MSLLFGYASGLEYVEEDIDMNGVEMDLTV